MTTNLMRLKLDMSAVADMMLDTIPSEVWDNPNATFFDPSMSAGQLLAEVVSRLRARGFSDENVAGRVFGFGDSKAALLYGVNNYKLLGQFEVANFLEVKMSKKFDVIISNPPYDGKAQLHQQFFNASVGQLVDGGSMVFIQPAAPYENKRTRRKFHEQEMHKLLEQHSVSTVIVPFSIFDGTGDSTNLAITTLCKDDSQSSVIDNIIYRDGTEYKNVPLKDVNVLGCDPTIYRSVVAKIEAICVANGSLYDIAKNHNDCEGGAYFAGKMLYSSPRDIRLVNPDNKYHTDYRLVPGLKFTATSSTLGIQIAPEEYAGFYSYAQTKVARFCMAIRQNARDRNNGELRFVPVVDFKRLWTDADLVQAFNITNEEWEHIDSLLDE